MATTIGLFLKILIETLANNDLLRLLILLTEVERMKHNWLFNLLRSSQFTHVSGPFLVRQLSYFLGGLRLSGFFSMLKTPPDQGVRWTHGSTGSAFKYSCIQNRFNACPFLFDRSAFVDRNWIRVINEQLLHLRRTNLTFTTV